MKTVKLELTETEKAILKAKKIRLIALADLAPDEIASLLSASQKRAKEIGALIAFQQIPSLGVGFAKELIDQGYYSLEQLKGKDPVELFNAYEQHIGAWADPCVEDSYRLLTHYIIHGDTGKRWWSFTAERKAYRAKHGFPANRPTRPWYELDQYPKMKAYKEASKSDV